ncbi:MAG: hypothetical protein D6690_10175, partial [Nitrospirae bacterium]
MQRSRSAYEVVLDESLMTIGYGGILNMTIANRGNEKRGMVFVVMTLICGMIVWWGAKTSSAAVLSTEDFKLYGFVDTSYVQNFNNPSNQINHLRIFDKDANAFNVHLAQIVLEREGKSGGSLADRAGFRVKLNFGEDSQFTGGSDFADEV